MRRVHTFLAPGIRSEETKDRSVRVVADPFGDRCSTGESDRFSCDLTRCPGRAYLPAGYAHVGPWCGATRKYIYVCIHARVYGRISLAATELRRAKTNLRPKTRDIPLKVYASERERGEGQFYPESPETGGKSRVAHSPGSITKRMTLRRAPLYCPQDG